MEGGAVSRQSEPGARDARVTARGAIAPGAPVGNRATARALEGLPARPAGRGLTADGLLARRLAPGATGERRLMRLTHKVTTTQGEFAIDNYDLHESATGDVQKSCGINIEVKYTSPTSLRSSQIGFVQVMKSSKNGTPYLFANEQPRATDATSGDAGWVVDRVGGKTRGFYGMNDDLAASGTNYWAGSRTSDTVATDAKMHDKVKLNRSPGMTVDVQATTFAVDIEHGVYLGAFTWGFTCDAAGTMAAKPLAIGRMGDPQRGAIAGWNTQAALADTTKRNAPGQQALPVPPPPPAPAPAPAAPAAPAPALPWYQRMLPWNW